jgi:hypothetical protein
VYNIAIPLVAGVVYYIDDHHYYSTGMLSPLIAWVYIGLSVVNTVIQAVTAGFILTAVGKIRKFMHKGLSASQINEKNLAVHAGAFVFYIVSLVLNDVFNFIYNWEASHFP